MNEQPAVWIGNLFAFIFVVMVIFNTIKAYNDPTVTNKLSDNFTIGYIYDSPSITEHNHVVNVKAIKTKTVKPPKPQLTQLQIDCIDSLVALGMKKTQAKQKANEIFQNHSFNNIQEFLNLALSKS